MAGNYTLTIVKPDAFASGKAGKIIGHLEAQGFKVLAARVMHMSQDEAGEFYSVHKERPFFGELVEMMTAASVVVQVLEGENAILKYREVMGATNPEKAAPGTIRKEFALSMGENSAHGSDAPETAKQEIAQFFKPDEIVS